MRSKLILIFLIYSVCALAQNSDLNAVEVLLTKSFQKIQKVKKTERVAVLAELKRKVSAIQTKDKQLLLSKTTTLVFLGYAPQSTEAGACDIAIRKMQMESGSIDGKVDFPELKIFGALFKAVCEP